MVWLNSVRSSLIVFALVPVLAGTLTGCRIIEKIAEVADDQKKKEEPVVKPSPSPSASATPTPSPSPSDRPIIGENERLIAVLQTNDVHGGLEPYTNKDGQLYGGMAMMGGVVKSIRQGLNEQLGTRAGVLMLDGGDQFQGSLISNYNEGELIIRTMNSIGYDAAVPGNHDYDFGPTGWLEDTVGPDSIDKDNKAVIKKLSKIANFPLISANTFLRDSFTNIEGKKISVKNVGCAPEVSSEVIDWSKVTRPDFLQSYSIKTIAGVRVAMIGIDNVRTAEATAISNISDFCWADEAETYRRVRNDLEGKADVFVMVLHNGNTDNEKAASLIVEKLAPAGQLPLVDAVVAGHTHMIHSDWINGVPIVQSGANGKLFGRINLIWDTQKKALVRSRSRTFAGISLLHKSCSSHVKTFCEADPATGVVKYEGKTAQPDAETAGLIAKEKELLAPIATQKLGMAKGKLWTDRLKESPLANFMTDALRKRADADLAIMNTGGLRAPLENGIFTYSDLFTVLPFNNNGIVLEMTLEKILKVLTRSAQSCGGHGGIMQSGFRLTMVKECKPGAPIDEKLQLLRVETVSGEVLLDVASGIKPDLGRKFQVATLDYLQNGGSGYTDFIGSKELRPLGIHREEIANYLISLSNGNQIPEINGQVDGRWTEVARPTEAGKP